MLHCCAAGYVCRRLSFKARGCSRRIVSGARAAVLAWHWPCHGGPPSRVTVDVCLDARRVVFLCRFEAPQSSLLCTACLSFTLEAAAAVKRSSSKAEQRLSKTAAKQARSRSNLRLHEKLAAYVHSGRVVNRTGGGTIATARFKFFWFKSDRQAENHAGRPETVLALARIRTRT